MAAWVRCCRCNVPTASRCARSRRRSPCGASWSAPSCRRERQDRGERLTDVAERAGVSTQYLSEVERGLKDPSSEILSAVAGALGLTVRQLSVRVARNPAPYGALCLAA